MAKVNREYQSRMEGMLFAHKIVTEKGLDALTKEIKIRNILKMDIWARKDEVEELHNNIAKNCYKTVMVAMLYTLHSKFGWGATRLKRLKEEFNKAALCTADLDYWGEHYATFQDYAKWLNDNCGMDFDEEAMKNLQELSDMNDPEYKRCELSGICNLLERNGYKDAAVFLRKKSS